jgi:hypothetical protein
MRKLVLITALWVAGIGAVAAAGWDSDTAKAATTAPGSGTIID